jgi:hypothetical protein
VNARALAGLVLLGAFGAALALLADRGTREGTDAAPSARAPGLEPPAFAGPGTCLPCHAEVVDEWRASMHAAAFTDPQVRAPEQSDNFRRTECLPCHAPAPLFEHGIEIGSRALARVERRVDGVDCLSCHALPGGGVAASRPGLGGACRPEFRAELSTHRMCYACHNQHATHDEWLASPAAEQGRDCLDCHMPRVSRAGGEAGAPRSGRSHRFLGGRDAEFALDGLRLEHRVDRANGRLVVALHNAFAGHNLPTDSRNRALDLVVTLYDSADAALPPARPEPRHPGGETGTARRRFRDPYRSSGDPNTQLPAGETATLELPLPAEARRATAELYYKLSPWVADDEAHWSHRVEIPLD